jgi:hypothetical protein
MGLLHQLTVPQGRWERIGIDFITDLPPSGAAGYDAIMSIIDHMTKRAHFIPYHKATGAEATAHLFIERYFPLHGIPGAIVSDRDKRFVNDFWQAFTKEVGTDIRPSSSAHPETDGQTEKANDVVGVHLKCFATRYVTTGTDKQDCKGWHRLLPLAEFAYNATPQKALGRSPFEVDLGYIPPSKIELIGAAIGGTERQGVRPEQAGQGICGAHGSSVAGSQGRPRGGPGCPASGCQHQAPGSRFSGRGYGSFGRSEGPHDI